MRYIDLEDFADALEEYAKNLRKALADTNYADSTVEVPSCDDTNAASKFIGNGFKIGHLWNDLGMKTREQKEKEEERKKKKEKEKNISTPIKRNILMRRKITMATFGYTQSGLYLRKTR